MESKNSTENLKICVRVRPLTADESTKKYSRALQTVDKKMIVLYEQVSEKLDALREKRKKEHKFAYDRVFSEDSTQSEVYGETTKDLIPFVLEGFNATVFAYGPTGTGKTYTMVGTAKQPGIMVMALNDLFTLMKKGDEKFQVSMSYLEIYNERIRDLLVTNPKNLELWENPRTGIIQVTDLSQVSTTSTSEVMKLLQKGNDRRSCESTAANKTSSRSHALLQINIRLSSHDHSVGEEVKTGRLFMVDLAGSERARRTQNVGMRLQEGASINKSLLALGNVINALAEGGAKFVNFRDSKLTRLLKDALTGNCKTVMIAHVSPANIHREESRNTLIYADKAKKISTKTRQNKIDVSYHISQYQSIISELKGEIRRLKSKLEEDALNTSGGSKGKTKPKDNKKIDALKKELVETFNEQMALRKKLMEIDNSIVAMSIEFEKQSHVIQEFENEKKSKKKGRRLSDESDPEQDEDDDEDDPEEILEVWEDLVYIHNEQNRYADMKLAINEELQRKKVRSKEIEESLPKQTNSYEQRELLALLCKVHELEIQQVEMARNAILKEHDLYRRDLLLMRYDRQRALCEEIITKQRNMLSESNYSYNQELEELYALYQLESQYTNNMKGSTSLGELNHLRSNSVMSMRPDKLPPLTSKEPEKLFRPGRRRNSDDRRPSTPLSISSPLGSPQINPSTGTTSLPSSMVVLPPIRGVKNTNFLQLQEGKQVRGATPTMPALKKIKRIYPLHKPNSLEDIVLESPRLNKKEKEKRNKNLNLKPRRSDSFSGLVKPNLISNRPKSDVPTALKLGTDFPSSFKIPSEVVPPSLRSGNDLPSPMRRGRPLKKEKDLGHRRGNSLGRIQDRRKEIFS